MRKGLGFFFKDVTLDWNLSKIETKIKSKVD